MRKPRSDSSLANLPPATREKLADLLLDGGSYADAKEWLHMDCNVETSEAALGGFWQHFCAPQRLRRAAQAADAFPELAGGLTEDWDAPSVAMVKQRFFELLAAPAADPEQVALFAKQIGEINKAKLEQAKLDFNRQRHEDSHRLASETLTLSREKFETDAAKLALRFVAELKTIAGNRGLTEPARIDAARRTLFGQDPNAQPKEAAL